MHSHAAFIGNGRLAKRNYNPTGPGSGVPERLGYQEWLPVGGTGEEEFQTYGSRRVGEPGAAEDLAPRDRGLFHQLTLALDVGGPDLGGLRADAGEDGPGVGHFPQLRFA